MTSVSSSVNPSGIVVPSGGLQQGNVAMTTINSQVVSGKRATVEAPLEMFALAHVLGFYYFCEMSQMENKKQPVISKNFSLKGQCWIFRIIYF